VTGSQALTYVFNSDEQPTTAKILPLLNPPTANTSIDTCITPRKSSQPVNDDKSNIEVLDDPHSIDSSFISCSSSPSFVVKDNDNRRKYKKGPQADVDAAAEFIGTSPGSSSSGSNTPILKEIVGSVFSTSFPYISTHVATGSIALVNFGSQDSLGSVAITPLRSRDPAPSAYNAPVKASLSDNNNNNRQRHHLRVFGLRFSPGGKRDSARSPSVNGEDLVLSPVNKVDVIPSLFWPNRLKDLLSIFIRHHVVRAERDQAVELSKQGFGLSKAVLALQLCCNRYLESLWMLHTYFPPAVSAGDGKVVFRCFMTFVLMCISKK
jgi:hypothetical protein